MKRLFVIIIFCTALSSCAQFFERKEYNFDNFNGTALEQLSMAVRADDADKIHHLFKLQKLSLDDKDPKYHHTLLDLAIVNKKKNAFTALLEHDANPNVVSGELSDATPLLIAIETVEDCDLYFIEGLVKHKANPNYGLVMPPENNWYSPKFPLAMAIGARNDEGNECVNLVKLLINNGANVNYKYAYSPTGTFNNIFDDCLSSKSIETLKYIVVDLKTSIPNPAYIKGGVDKTTQEEFTLTEILNTKDFQFNHSYEQIKAKDEILEYLKVTGKN